MDAEGRHMRARRDTVEVCRSEQKGIVEFTVAGERLERALGGNIGGDTIKSGCMP